VPSSTHLASWRLVRRSAGSTRCHPCTCRPRISMRRAFVVATTASECAGSTRTKTPPWPLAATAMLPPMRNASPLTSSSRSDRIRCRPIRVCDPRVARHRSRQRSYGKRGSRPEERAEPRAPFARGSPETGMTPSLYGGGSSSVWRTHIRGTRLCIVDSHH
jgi:hypothetical protein